MKTKLLLTSLLGMAFSASAWAQDAWPQPESAYSSTQPRAQWLTPPEAAAPQPVQPPYGYAPQAPTYGYGYQAAPPPQGYAPQGGYGYYGYGYRPYAPRHNTEPWQRWQPNNMTMPSWDNFSMPSPSVNLPSFSFPSGPFGW